MFTQPKRKRGQNNSSGSDIQAQQEQNDGLISNDLINNNIDGLQNLSISNEANNRNISNDPSPIEGKDFLAYLYDNDLNNFKIRTNKNKKRKKGKKEEIRNEIIEDEDEEENSIEEVRILDDDDPDNLIELDKTIQHEAKDKFKGKDEFSNLFDPDQSISNEKDGKSKKSRAKKEDEKEKPSLNDDLIKADNDMKPTGRWDFTPLEQKLDERKKPGMLKRLGSWFAYYGGKFVGKIGNIAVSIFNFLTGGKAGRSNPWKAMKNNYFSSHRDYQQNRDRKNIPGWDGAKFENRSDNKLNIDFRRVPDIWSYPIAEEPMDEKGNEKNPVISVYIDQTSREMTVDEEGAAGHSSIGIEFSRKNPVTGEWDRYNLRYGYFKGGGLKSKAAAGVTNYNNANVPGQLKNERNHTYTVSRRFKANNNQVNAVLNASEKYPDRGYNVYTRNCTTFVRDMIVDAAGFKSAESIFEKDTVNMPSSSDRRMFGASVMASVNKSDMENTMDEQAHEDDMNYQGFGNKMVTKEDYDRYKSSLKLYTSRPDEAHSANVSAENIHRLEGPDSGDIGALPMEIRNAAGEILSKNAVKLNQNLKLSGEFIKNTLTRITPDRMLAEGSIPAELQKIIQGLDFLDIPMMKILSEDPMMINGSKAQLRQARTKLSQNISDLNILLFKYYNNDKRLHDPVVNTIAIMEHLISNIDEVWKKNAENEEKEFNYGNLGNIRKDFYDGRYTFWVGNTSVIMSPSTYESYLQIYKTPNKALNGYIRYLQLCNLKNQQNNALSGENEKEYNKLKRIDDLAHDFDKSHRYMLEKEKYSQQDVDYAFALEKNERQTENEDDDLLSNEIFKGKDHTASATYRLLIMRKIFGSMENDYKSEALEHSEELKDIKVVQAFLERRFVTTMNIHSEEMKMMIRAIIRSMPDRDENKVREKVFDQLDLWLERLSLDGLDDGKLKDIEDGMRSPERRLYQEVDSLTKEIMAENDQNREQQPDEGNDG